MRSGLILNTIRPRSASCRRLLLVVASVLLVGGVVAGVALAHANRGKTVKYAAYLTANPDAKACLSQVGLYSGLQSPPKYRMPRAKQEKLANANRPASPRLKIGERTYSATIDPATSGHGGAQIWWSFKVIPTTRQTSLKLIGQRATVEYRVGKKSYALHTKVQDGRCKTVF